jgi:methylated-DNA-[protein]-cysteine S-methyltransferase
VTIVSPELDARFRAAAAATGLLDAAFDILPDTPIGDLLVGVTDHGLCRIHFDPDPERELESLARLFGPRVLRSAKPVDRVRRQLDEYFAGKRRAFDVDRDLRPVPEFNRRVLTQLADVAYGTTTTYGELARELGSSRSGGAHNARAVGAAVGATPIPIVIPCHRVIGADGSLTGYGGGLPRKRALLTLEATGGDRGAMERALRERQLTLL